MFDDKQISFYKERLESKMKDLKEQIESLKTVPDFGSDVDHFEEEAEEAEAFSGNLGVSSALNERLLNIQRALDKIDAGTYGKCEECGGEIEKEVLDVDPESRLCRECKLKAN
ncbi:MAG: hypothetical protein COU07_03460 [Candidatus Harrisonbacteria bacterium CG10_big_fil_rev_8_21_14_0_10_40_38]|uniref:Zinc finger DksA/TraR C4-type domain-containing protein n=1 Tax=Candidatus Harrisonbacteria bacterium CG10_big_fil_rev_8_21_14_0_10_40_38 TaxID=1974583 RepID=A0A2H0UR89_9BACT|nr:MAG: hypothetical protein COU07_03460 [Candidatus Harrisonbacteria bacterium CG10_big_fil_rev_8_21_14_0_10_40_38]